MFRRKLNNVAAITSPPSSSPPIRTIVNNPPNYAGVIVTIVLAVPFLVFIGREFLICLMDDLGSIAPERDAAKIIVGLLCFLGVTILAVVISRVFLDRVLRYKIEMAEVIGQWKYKQLQAQRQSVGNSRTMSEDVRLVRLIESVMAEAYDHLEEHGQYTKNDPKPWSRENAKRRVLLGEREPVGWTLGSQVRGWLAAKGVLRGDLVNINRFPDLGRVQEALRLDFEIPIQVNPPALRDNAGYDFVKNRS